jgi:hypothetical protein
MQHRSEPSYRQTQIKEAPMSENNTRPVHLRYGNVVAAVWANNNHASYFTNTTFTRLYKDGEQWGDQFEDRDLPNLAKAAADVHTWIFHQKAQAVTVSGTDPG